MLMTRKEYFGWEFGWKSFPACRHAIWGLIFLVGVGCAGSSKPLKAAVAPAAAAVKDTLPVIHSFSPSEARFGTLLTIYGENFSAVREENHVTLNGVPASIHAATPEQITLEVPKNKLCTGPLYVTVNKKTVRSSARFTYVPTATVTTFAGSTAGPLEAGGLVNGNRITTARFSRPAGIAVDEMGSVYVADTANHRIRKILENGEVMTLAGSAKPDDKGIVEGGFADGSGRSAARFHLPFGIAVDKAGNVYVADAYNNRIRKVSPTGRVSTLAGSEKGFADGDGTAARFHWPADIVMDGAGNLYVADAYNHRIRKMSPKGNGVEVSTLAGNGASGEGKGGHVDGPKGEARLNEPYGLALGADGNLYVAEHANKSIRKVTPAGEASTRVGGAEGVEQFSSPSSITTDAVGNLYVTDMYNHRIRMVTPAGTVITLAGGTLGVADGAGDVAQFTSPWGIAMDKEGNLYVADTGNHRICKIVLE